MDVDLYRRAQAIFEATVDLAPGERDAALRDACGADATLADLVAGLLAADLRTSEMDTSTGLGIPGCLARGVLRSVAPGTIGPFRVVGELGRGGMGVVYEAEQERPRRRVALKTLPGWHSSADAVALFHREIQAMAQVVHPGIPSVYEVFEAGGLPVLAMELVEGLSLDLAATTRTLRQRAALIEQLADAIQAAHDAGVIHRDLKPSNVLVTAAGRIKVLDFGIAALALDGARAAGTTAYAAPEQLAGAAADVRSDVYGLGAVAWTVLVGAPPIEVRGLALPEVLVAKARRPRPPPGLPRPLAAILTRALDPDPAARYASARAVADDIGRFLQHRPVHALPGHLRHFVAAHLRRLAPAIGLTLAGGALAAALGLGVTTWLKRQADAAAEARAAGLLADIQASAWAGDLDGEALSRSFDLFARDPAQDGTRALSQGWRWRADQLSGDARRRALASAWTTSDVPEDSIEALAAIAPILAAEARWTALSAALERLPEGRARPERLALALAGWDFEAAAAFATPDQAPLLSLFAGARPGPTGDNGVILPGGDFMVATGASLRRVRGDGSVARAWTIAGLNARMFVRGDEVWLTRHAEGDERIVLRLDPARDEPPTPVESFPAAITSLLLADLDGDGVDERYTGLGPYQNSLLVAEPPGQRSRVLHPPTDLLRADIDALAAADLDGDGLPELAVGSYGWHDHDIRALRGCPDAPTLAGRIRVGGRTVAVLPDPAGVDTLVSVGRPVDAVRMVPSPDLLVRARLGPAGLEPAAVREGPLHYGFIAQADLDGDGIADLATWSAQGLHLLRQRPDGLLVELLVPGLEFVAAAQLDDDPADELWVRGGGRGWILGLGDDRLPQRALKPPPPSAAVPIVAEGSARRTWERAEALVGLGLAADAADSLAALGDRPGPLGVAALARATELLASSDREAAAELARRLIARRDLAAEHRQVALDALMAVHAFADLDAHRQQLGPRWRAVPGRVSERTALVVGSAMHPAVQVRAPEATRLGAREPGVELVALAGHGELLRVPMRWDGEALALELDIDVRELDWSGALHLSLESGSWRAAVELQHTGGGLAANGHQLRLGCALGEARRAAWLPFETGPRRVRLSWVAARGELRCALDDRTLTLEGASPSAGEVVLRLGTPDPETARLPLVRARLTRLEVAGTQLASGSHEPEAARRLGAGEPDALRALMASGTSFQRAVAAAALGEHARFDLGELDRRALRALLRLDPERWTGPVAAALGEGFVAAWADAWEIALKYREPAALAAVLHPALGQLDLDDPTAARVALLRAEVLLDGGRRAEALVLLERLRADPTHAEEAELLLARERARVGDPSGARLAIKAALKRARAPELTIDRIAADHELRALLPADVAPSRALRQADARP